MSTAGSAGWPRSGNHRLGSWPRQAAFSKRGGHDEGFIRGRSSPFPWASCCSCPSGRPTGAPRSTPAGSSGCKRPPQTLPGHHRGSSRTCGTPRIVPAPRRRRFGTGPGHMVERGPVALLSFGFEGGLVAGHLGVVDVVGAGGDEDDRVAAGGPAGSLSGRRRSRVAAWSGPGLGVMRPGCRRSRRAAGRPCPGRCDPAAATASSPISATSPARVSARSLAATAPGPCMTASPAASPVRSPSLAKSAASSASRWPPVIAATVTASASSWSASRGATGAFQPLRSIVVNCLLIRSLSPRAPGRSNVAGANLRSPPRAGVSAGGRLPSPLPVPGVGMVERGARPGSAAPGGRRGEQRALVSSRHAAPSAR